MCRYAMYGPYKEHYACFHCRKGFKWPQDARQRPPKEQQPDAVKCPQCGEPMASMGLDFRTPRQRDTRQWEKVQQLFLRGYTYHSCGCGGPGYRPRTLREVPGFLASLGPGSEGDALLRRFAAREQGGARWKRETSASENQHRVSDHWPRPSVLTKVRAR